MAVKRQKRVSRSPIAEIQNAGSDRPTWRKCRGLDWTVRAEVVERTYDKPIIRGIPVFVKSLTYFSHPSKAGSLFLHSSRLRRVLKYVAMFNIGDVLRL